MREYREKSEKRFRLVAKIFVIYLSLIFFSASIAIVFKR